MMGVGATGVPVDLAVSAVGLALLPHYLLANVVGYAVAVSWNFYWNYRLVWNRPARPFGRMFAEYVGADAVFFGVRAALIWALVEIVALPGLHHPLLPVAVPAELVATLLGILVVAVGTFVVADRWVFDETTSLNIGWPAWLGGRHLLIVVGSVLVAASVATAVATAPPTVTPNDRDASGVVVGVQGPGVEGAVVAYGPHGGERWRYENAASYHDVTILPNGSVLAAFAAGEATDCGPFPRPCVRTGYRIIDPTPSPHVVAEWSFPVRSLKDSEVHDVEYLRPGQYLVADMDRERLLLVANGSVEWTWHADSVYDAPPDVTRTDWLHINDVDVLDDGRILVSVRNANQLLVLERTRSGADVVDRINADRNTSILRGQHNPHWLGNDTVLVADSSNDRVVELRRGPSGNYRVSWGVDSANGLAFAWPRDADRLPDGSTLITDSRHHRVVRIAANGSVIQSWRTDKLPYDAEVVDVGDEPAAGVVPPHAPGPAPAADGEANLPVVGRIAVGLHHSIGLPWFVTEHTLAGVLVGGLLALVGIGHTVVADVALPLARRVPDQ